MASYKFKLQNILELKQSIEDQKKNELGAAMQRLEREKERLEYLKNEMHEMTSEFEKATSRGIPINELKLILDFIEYYKRSIVNQKTKIKMAQDYMEMCRQELIKATQEKKMMEKLKEIDYKKYQYIEQKKEEKLVDDLVSFKESASKQNISMGRTLEESNKQ